MKVKQAINKRRAYRALEPIEITTKLINDLAESAQLAASCFNNQPWGFVFVHTPPVLKEIFSALSPGNRWAQAASMIIVVFSKKENDCVLPGREYYLFDTGMATAHIILRATELGLVAHPIAGYDETRVKTILEIPEDITVITLVIVGKHSDTISEILSEKQAQTESKRPKRKPLDEFIIIA